MVQAPYWIAARIYSVAAGTTARSRISGAYTLATGRDLDNLPPHLYLDVVEAWIWERFTKQDDVDQWLDRLNRPPTMRWDEDGLIEGLLHRGVQSTANRILALTAADVIDDSPPGWSNEELLAESRSLGVVIE